MKTRPIFLRTLLLAAPLGFWLQGNALAQGAAGPDSPQPMQAEAQTNAADFRNDVVFVFPGGTPEEFLQAVDRQYKVDWRSVADISGDMYGVRIPKLRLSRESLDRLIGRRGGGGGGGRAGFVLGVSSAVGEANAGGRGGGGGGIGQIADGGGFGGRGGRAAALDPLQGLLALYASIAQVKPELGELRVEGDLVKPSFVMFRSTPPGGAQREFKMKAFALQGIPTNEWMKLARATDEDLSRLANDQGAVDMRRAFEVNVHPDTGLLVVMGPEGMLQAAESIVVAWRENHSAEAPMPPWLVPPQTAVPAPPDKPQK